MPQARVVLDHPVGVAGQLPVEIGLLVQVADTYTNALFKSMGDLKTGLMKASDGAQPLASGSQQLGSGSRTIADNLRTLNQATSKISSGAAQFNKISDSVHIILRK